LLISPRVLLAVAWYGSRRGGGVSGGSVSFGAPGLVIANGTRRGAAVGFEGLRRGGAGQRGGWQRCLSLSLSLSLSLILSYHFVQKESLQI
jgi:hypothetical protein